MRTKPWPIIILAAFYILGPLFNTLAGALLVMRVPYGQYLHALYHLSSPWELFKLLCLYPIAGIAILSVRAWSYPVFIIVMGFAFFDNFQDWRHHSRIFTLPMLLGTIAFNAGLVGYFLLPAVRAAYFDKRLRWWESKPRYEVRLRGRVEFENGEISRCSILNLSEGGVFVKTSKPLAENSVVRLVFMVLSQTVDIKAKVVFVRQAGTGAGYGMEFQHTDQTDVMLQRIAKALMLVGLRPRLVKPDWRESLKLWFKTVVTTGRGLVPEVPAQSINPRAELDLVLGMKARLEQLFKRKS